MAEKIYHGRYTAQIEGDFVVFLIGARFHVRNLLRARWIAGAMGKMQSELFSRPETGFLGGENFFRFFPIETLLISYWRSFDDLERFSRDRDEAHYPAWIRFYKEVGLKDDIGIWHETYLVRAGEYECMYGNMPQFGLGGARDVNHISVKDASRARQRAHQDDKPETMPSPDQELLS
ncbi:MAG: DUF4188 domain-containing protein [Chloroflexota bacterium]